MNILNRVEIINRLRKNINDRNTALGAVTSALFCPICFPAMAGVASALGLSFLTRYEGIFLILFYIFMFISLYSVWNGVRQHKVKLPLVISSLGTLLVFVSLFQIIPIYSIVYLGMAFLVGGAFFNAYHAGKFSERSCDCDTVTE